MLKNPIEQLTQNIEKYNIQLDILNDSMVGSLRTQLYREKLARGESLDIEAMSFLHFVPSYWGTEQYLAELRLRMVDVIELVAGAEILKRVILDAVHKAQHEVLGECMYEYMEDVFYQYCDVWKVGPKSS